MGHVRCIEADNINAGCLHFSDLWPFAADSARSAVEKGKTFIVVEQNSTAQFGHLIREQTGLFYDKAILKYDGRPFFPSEIVSGIKNLLK